MNKKLKMEFDFHLDALNWKKNITALMLKSVWVWYINFFLSYVASTLTGENASVVWDPEKDEIRSNKLVIKQILLGVDAKDGEYNVIQVII